MAFLGGENLQARRPPTRQDRLHEFLRQVLAAHFVRDCEHIVEIGGHIRPVTDYLTHTPKSVLSVDPKTPPYAAEVLNGRPCRVRHVARKFQEVTYDYEPLSYGLVLLGYSLKPFGSREPLGQLLFGLIDNAKTVVLEYPPALERASAGRLAGYCIGSAVSSLQVATADCSTESSSSGRW